MKGRSRTLAVAAFGGLLAACSSVLGLDAPTLDPCFADASATTCANASVDGAAPDAMASTDARSDRNVVVDGVRCGGGAYPAVGCTGSTPVCCQITGDAGPTYACRASADACEGYAIACASDDDCSGSNICCHFASAIKCEKTSVCTDEELVCEPGAPSDCPSGWKCTVTRVLDGVSAPYYGCAPP